MPRNTLSRDILWNIAGLGIAGVCGVGVNYWVGVAYGAAALGVFNQVFAAYTVVSQLAVLGVHSSVLYHVAASHERGERRAVLSSALLVTFGIAIVMAGLFVALAEPVARLLDSPGVAHGMWLAAPGLVCFALNKVVLAALNGAQHMRAYATFQAGRVVLMTVALGGCIVVGAAPSTLPVILTIAEGTTLALALFAARDMLGRPGAAFGHWLRVHLRFGLRGFLSGLFGELNNRIDVLILGAFSSDALVGAYSFASLIAEGLMQILVALRSNYAPIVVRLLADQHGDELTRFVRKARNRTYLGALVCGALAVGGYLLVMPFMTHDADLQRSGVYFAILLAGIVTAAGYMPFNQILLWGGRPGWHTVLCALIVGSSAALCIALVATASAVGAAVGMALTYAVSTVLLRVIAARVLRVRI